MPNLEQFSLTDMVQLGAALRRMGRGAGSMEEVATRATRHVHDSLVDGRGKPASALVRFFKTHKYAELPVELQSFARSVSGDAAGRPGLRCLTLLATAGARPEWNSRRSSVGHQAIPLLDEAALDSAPMIASLVRQLGLTPRHVLEPEPSLFLESRSTSFNVFHVPVALRSPMVPSQESFVAPFGVRSVVGFGGGLPSGDIFAMILFARVAIPSDTAQLFKTLSLNLKLAVTPYAERVFA